MSGSVQRSSGQRRPPGPGTELATATTKCFLISNFPIINLILGGRGVQKLVTKIFSEDAPIQQDNLSRRGVVD